MPVLAERQKREQHASGDMPLFGKWHISASLHDVHGSLWLQSRLGNVFCFIFQLRKSLPGIKIRVQLVEKREWILERQLSCVKKSFISECATHYIWAFQPFPHHGTEKIVLV